MISQRFSLATGCLAILGFAAAGVVTARPGEVSPRPLDDAPVYDREVRLAYTVNTFGWLDTCG